MAVLDSLDIAIIGAGSAGPAAAFLLARLGHNVKLYDQASSKLPVGAGFMLLPSGMEVLQELGCLEQTLNATQKLKSLFCKTAGGKTLLELHYKEVREDFFGAGTQRASFLDILLEVCEQDNVDVIWNTKITDILLEKDKRLLKAEKETIGSFDLVILADGANSPLRAQLDIPQKVSVYPWGALWFIGKRTEEFAANKLWQVVHGTHTLNGFLPTGTDDDLLSFFYSFKLSEESAFRQQSLDPWKEKVLTSTPEATNFLDQVTSHEQLKIAKYHDVVMPHWHCDRAVILGDSAHALSPQLGQGVNLALQDARSLAHCIEHAASLPQALAEYSRERRKQIKFYQFATRSITPMFQSERNWLGKLRDFAFPIATKSKWVRKQMTLSMAGYKDGILSSRPIKL